MKIVISNNSSGKTSCEDKDLFESLVRRCLVGGVIQEAKRAELSKSSQKYIPITIFFSFERVIIGKDSFFNFKPEKSYTFYSFTNFTHFRRLDYFCCTKRLYK